MLVYGDHVRRVAARPALDALRERLVAVGGAKPGLERHAGLVAALIEAGALVQGSADAAWAARGADADGPAERGAMAVLTALAGAVWQSWCSDFSTLAALPFEALPRLLGAGTPDTVEARVPEGFAFYAVYPEGYGAAAAASGFGPDTLVLGLRSIGVPLAAVVAAVLGASPPVTLRPTGHPFARTLSLDPTLEARLAASTGSDHAVVDEGPGLSGSSFGSVGDLLDARGVRAGHIGYFPSHPHPPGSMASARHRERWAASARFVVDADALILNTKRPAHRLATWIADLLGPLARPLDEVSGGGWRAARTWAPGACPPAAPFQERRKFLATAGSGLWLAKFVGLGAEGERKVAMARALAAAGWTPPTAGLCHGFHVTRWEGGARALDLRATDAGTLATHAGAYLAARVRLFADAPTSGATPAALLAMAQGNIAEALGPGIAEACLDRWTPGRLDRLARSWRPVLTDNRLHAWEWLVQADGSLLKTDAVDHHAAHDLIGCQDLAWDLAGAAVELELDPDATDRLHRVVAQNTGRLVDPSLTAFALPCYLAFQLGLWSMALHAAPDPDEAVRLTACVARYASALRRLAGAGP